MLARVSSFGKINIPDFAGNASLTSKFGELTTGKIPNAKTIHVEFGKAEIGRLNNADRRSIHRKACSSRPLAESQPSPGGGRERG